MTELSAIQLDMSRKIERTILSALSNAGQVEVAKLLGIHESTVSRFKDGHIETLSNLLAALDLKLVPTSFRTIDPERMKAFCTLFEAAMTRPDSLEHLLLESE